MHTKRKYHNDIYIPFLHISSPRSLVTYISYYILSLIRVYIIRILQLFSREYDIYTKYIIYIHFNISHHTLETYHVSYEVSYMIWFVSFSFFLNVSIYNNIYIYITCTYMLNENEIYAYFFRYRSLHRLFTIISLCSINPHHLNQAMK